jgi:hypothetical protein
VFPVAVQPTDLVASLRLSPNLGAVKARIKTALKQIAKERLKDPIASTGVIVLGEMYGDQVSLAIQGRMTRQFPQELK